MTGPSQVVAAHYDAIRRRDLEAVLSTLAEDVVWDFPESDVIPFAGHYVGRNGVRDFFRKIGASVDVIEFHVDRTVVDGCVVIVFGHERFAVKATGVEWATGWVQVHTVERGRIVRFREYADTAAIARAYLGPPGPDAVDLA